MGQLAASVASLTAAGDLEGARVATDALSCLLASASTGSASVVDIRTRRKP
jgi:hypothetical protein